VDPGRGSRDKASVLYRISGAFAKREINMELFTSRPNGRTASLFYIEMNGHQSDKQIIDALSEMRNLGYEIKVLGSYKDSRWREAQI
jgi:prephenate dehydratase